MSKIKQIKQKIGNEFPDQRAFPLGADGINIDMFSGLNLEEELTVGGNHDVHISETEEEGEKITTIFQYYYKKETDPETNETIKKYIYTVKTTIKEIQRKTIINISLINPVDNTILRKKTITCTDADIWEELK